MKTYLFLFFLLLPLFLKDQNQDTVYIKQVDSLIQLSRDFTAKSDFDKALELNNKADSIALTYLGEESAAYGICCSNLGRILAIKGDYLKTEKWFLKAKTIFEKALGKEHPDYTSSLNNLAILYYFMGKYEKAEPIFLEAISLNEKVLGKEHPDYIGNLSNLASVYEKMGLYEKAEPLNINAKDIREKTLGKEHPDYGVSLSNLSGLYMSMGQYEKAEPLKIKAKVILEKSIGKDHPHYSASLNNLANLYMQMGQFEKAKTLFLEAKAINERAFGKENPDYAVSLNNLAGLYMNMDQYEKVEPILLEAKAIREKVIGKEHPDYARTLNSLAKLYLNMGQFEKAETLYLEATDVREKALGNNHPDYARSLSDLADLYLYMGQYEKSEPILLEVKAIREKALLKEHPEYAQSLNSLALLYRYLSQYEKAEPYYLELSSVNRAMIAKALLHLSERELGKYLNMFSKSRHQALSFIQLSESEKVSAMCFNNSLFYKGFLLQASNQLKSLATSSPEAAEKFIRLKGYGRRLAGQYSMPDTDRDSSLIAKLEDKANQLEKDLTRSVAGFGEARQQVNWKEVQATLKTGEAAIEFVYYRYYEKQETDSTMYAALVIKPNAAEPEFIPLFEEKQITKILKKNEGTATSDFLVQTYSRGVTPIKTGHQQGLYELILKPLEKQLEGVKTIYFSPGGLLHRINFGAIPLPGEKGKTFADKYELVHLGSTRSLVIPNLTKVNASNEAVLFGGINYEIDTTTIFQDTANLEPAINGSEGLSFLYADRSIPSRGENWDYLQGTAEEVETIKELIEISTLKPNKYSGKTATEEIFKQLGKNDNAPRVLHIATHGFFFPDPGSSGKTENETGSKESVFKMSEHPMIRSGLIMAGGNHAWKTGKPFKEGTEDGILTAYEISQMNLSNTELVVLSACETGLGDIEGNEGVYGLQRAFKIAGAKYLIMSLWQVPDRETKDFMVAFYRHWLEGKMTIPDAFRKTQQEMKERFYNPYQWAGFVLVE